MMSKFLFRSPRLGPCVLPRAASAHHSIPRLGISIVGLTVRSLPKYPVRFLSSQRRNEDQDGQNVRSRTGTLASIAAVGTLLAGKTKYLLVGLKLTKAAPLVSMVISSAMYSLIFGVPYAVGMVGLIFVHECGHALVMRHYGLPFSPMVFVPFMGAFIAMEREAEDCYQDAIIAFGGPVLGSAAALATAGAASVTDSQLLYALADWGLLINLFNMLPIGSMDGGRIAGAISPYFGVAGLAGGGALVYMDVVSNPIMYLILAGGAYSTFTRFWGSSGDDEDARRKEQFYNIGGAEQAQLMAAYLAVVGGLLLAMRENNKHRKTPKQIQRERDLAALGISSYSDPVYDLRGGDGAVYDDYFSSWIDDERE